MIKELYHLCYEEMQRLNLVGSWRLSEREHLRIINDVLPCGEINVLYDGTATGRNPLNVETALKRQSYTPNIWVIDLTRKPLEQVLKANPTAIKKIQADATCLPFSDKHFDLITTDFLLNMMPSQEGVEVIREMARVLKEDGLISMTLFTQESMKHRSPIVEFVKLLGHRHFASTDFWQEEFKKAGLNLTINYFKVKNKPFFYPTDLFPHFIAFPITTVAQVERPVEVLSNIPV